MGGFHIVPGPLQVQTPARQGGFVVVNAKKTLLASRHSRPPHVLKVDEWHAAKARNKQYTGGSIFAKGFHPYSAKRRLSASQRKRINCVLQVAVKPPQAAILREHVLQQRIVVNHVDRAWMFLQRGSQVRHHPSQARLWQGI